MNSNLCRAAALTASALVLGSGLAACGGSTSSGTPVWPGIGRSTSAAPTADAPATTAPAPTPGSSVRPTDMAAKLQQAAEATTTAHMTMTMGVAGQNVTAQGDVQEKPLVEDMTMSLMGMKISVIFVDNTLYMKVPGTSMGGKWLKASPQELSSASGLGSLGALTDPLALWAKIGGAIRSAQYDGTDAVGQHYTMQVDSAKLVKALGLPQSELGKLDSTMPTTVGEDVWFSADGHVVQTKADLGSTGTATMTMSDFGKRVDISAPPASQTLGLGSLPGL